MQGTDAPPVRLIAIAADAVGLFVASMVAVPFGGRVVAVAPAAWVGLAVGESVTVASTGVGVSVAEGGLVEVGVVVELTEAPVAEGGGVTVNEAEATGEFVGEAVPVDVELVVGLGVRAVGTTKTRPIIPGM